MVETLQKLEGRTAIITGSSEGLGTAIASPFYFCSSLLG